MITALFMLPGLLMTLLSGARAAIAAQSRTQNPAPNHCRAV
jgi:hypothetical protein